MVDTRDLKSLGVSCAGSTPVLGSDSSLKFLDLAFFMIFSS